MNLASGQIIRVRSRQYLIEEVISPSRNGGDTRVRLSCLEDDARGQPLEVFWEREIDAKVLGESSWDSVSGRGFDDPRYFSAYFHTLCWNRVTATDPKLFQAPYRAGIQVKAYQLEPLRKALQQPRVALFIADDVGLGKTIEAGLILREMLLRQKVNRVVIACPPSVVNQWREEMENRFGLIFQVIDRDFVARVRVERGYGVNPWTTGCRFIISHALLRDETYAAPLRDWLGEFSTGAMLILDEAHNAAPASGSRYAIDSRLTKSVREIAPRFEHKLFLSATPHNGHSNSFAALLEMLDPQRFCRGVPVKSQKLLDAVMVRRLKQDLRAIGDRDFPERQVIPLAVTGLPEDAPELELARLLGEYRACREERLKDSSKSVQNTATLVITSLQKRLLSSIEAFARTLKVHRAAIEKQAEKQTELKLQNLSLLQESPDADDERSELPENEVAWEEDTQMTVATRATNIGITRRELELLSKMEAIANAARYRPDGRIELLLDWIKANLCPNLGEPGAEWLDRRVLIFTEYTDTKGYLERQLEAALAGSDRAGRRIATFHGGIGDERREAIKAAFNSDPKEHPLRILIATDAAREGVNLQNHCADLFHFDIPWNPSRMEQRNGRIDRKLQRENTVRCYYFILPQRPEDRVLEVLVRKTETIQRELGNLSPVIEKNLSKLLDRGIRATEERQLADRIANIENHDPIESGKVIREELEMIRPEIQKLVQSQMELEEMLKKSRQWLKLDSRHFRDALSASLEILGARPLRPLHASASEVDLDSLSWELPDLNERFGVDPTWAATLDTLRAPRPGNQKLWDWRKEAPIRPLVFADPNSLDGKVVHLHLEHRLVQRLLSRFLSQGFLYHELNKACVCLTRDPIPKVIVLGRLSLYGDRASRLHDEIVAVAAQWLDPSARGRSKLRPLGEGEKGDVLAELEESLASPSLRQVSDQIKERFRDYVKRDVEELIPHLQSRAETLLDRATRDLAKRGKKEAEEMKQLLIEQRKRIVRQEEETKVKQLSLFSTDELRQLEADRRHWQTRLEKLAGEIESEPERIEQMYQVRACRVEPVGIVYLWPVSN
ncbi:DISARM system SNF2-like helicase DrmD [Pannus brasiliensis CCIBt3594]|uniref:DISARM system SNF2-like helicase DrmD n=1 Tax=Pannus brasiliensis CCIBt3594 TaxID=1427578 RepID=A0AAW9QSC0_9CHRO